MTTSLQPYEHPFIPEHSRTPLVAASGKMTRHVQLLSALIATEVFNPMLAQLQLMARLASIALFALVCVAVFRALFVTKHHRRVGSALAGLTLLIDVIRMLGPTEIQRVLEVLINISAASFFIFVLSVIVEQVFGARQLRTDDVVGAFSGYILIAMLWGRLYALTWMYAPTSFRINPDVRWQFDDWNTLHSLFDYYSFTTISSIGYADITTTAPVTNTLVWLEVMCGQFYLAVVVATIVGIKVSQALSAPRDGS